MPGSNSQEAINRKSAHRKALARLAEDYDVEYAVYLAQVHREQPHLKQDAYARKARALLRIKFPHSFHLLFNEEKVKVGLPPSPTDWVALGKEIVRLYNNGKGLTRKEISDKLGVSYLTIRRKIQAHQRKEMAEKSQWARDLETTRLGWKKMYEEEGLSIREIGQRVNKPYGTVRTGLLVTGTLLRAKGGPRGPRKKTSE